MRGRERVVDIEIGEAGESIGEGGVVRLLVRVEAQVLQQHDIARRERGHGRLHLLADTVRDEADRAATERPGERRGKGPERHGLDPLALRPAEMRGDDHPRAARREFFERGRHPVDPRGVADGARPHRHVEVDADEDALARDLDVVE